MINNRQNGRRRGRGGQQPRNGQPGGPDRGNRLDNRARGNAAQLLEKYKTLARDAQMQGDRVNTEYYLQFADHYFRVLSENRARFEEQRPPRSSDNRDDYGSDDEAADAQRGYQSRDDQGGDDGWDDGEQPSQPQREYQRDHAPRQERQDRAERTERVERQAPQGDGEVARESREGNGRTAGRERGRRGGNAANGIANGSTNGSGNGFAPDFLHEPLTPRIEMDRPPESVEAQQAEGDASPAEEAAPKRRRPRRPRAETVPVEG